MKLLMRKILHPTKVGLYIIFVKIMTSLICSMSNVKHNIVILIDSVWISV